MGRHTYELLIEDASRGVRSLMHFDKVMPIEEMLRMAALHAFNLGAGTLTTVTVNVSPPTKGD